MKTQVTHVYLVCVTCLPARCFYKHNCFFLEFLWSLRCNSRCSVNRAVPFQLKSLRLFDYGPTPWRATNWISIRGRYNRKTNRIPMHFAQSSFFMQWSFQHRNYYLKLSKSSTRFRDLRDMTQDARSEQKSACTGQRNQSRKSDSKISRSIASDRSDH